MRAEKALSMREDSLPPPEIRESGINGLEKKKGEKFRQELQTFKKKDETRNLINSYKTSGPDTDDMIVRGKL